MNLCYQGLAASPGIAIGTAWLFSPQTPKIIDSLISSDSVDDEIQLFKNAQDKVEAHLQKLYENILAAQGSEEAEIFASHIELLRDEEFEKDTIELIKGKHYSASRAVKEYLDQAAEAMRALDDDYLKERAAEFEDLQNNLLLALNNLPFTSLSTAPPGSIIFAKDLSPSETAQLNPDNIQGFVLTDGGLTSHVAILARNMGLPAVMGAADILENIENGADTVLDGNTGEVIIYADAATVNIFRNKQSEQERLHAEYAKLHNEAAVTADGTAVKLYSNIGSLQDLHLIEANNTEGVGLFRSEFLFMKASSLPSEEQQYQVYKKAAEHLAGKPLILRLADIGGDKPLEYISFPKEENPFLGWRGVRIYPEMQSLFDTQIRAALRASAYGNLAVMVPMVSNISEIQFVKKEAARQAVLLKQEGKSCNPNLKIGIMIETPAAALIAPQLAKEADFFSIGSNDLTQYTLAVDRGNTKIANLYDSLHPAVLKLMKMTADAAHHAGIEIGICGEMGGQTEAIPFLIGMGLDEISISGNAAAAVKYRIRQLNGKQCRELLEKAITLSNGDEVRRLLQ